jgi:hypothetical protein
MSAGIPTIMQLIGGSSSLVAASSFAWQANQAVAPSNITVASVMNSTAAAPSYAVAFTLDPPVVSVGTSSAASAFNSSNQTCTWFTSLGANSSNSAYSITFPIRAIQIMSSAGSTNQTITTTITQAG